LELDENEEVKVGPVVIDFDFSYPLTETAVAVK